MIVFSLFVVLIIERIFLRYQNLHSKSSYDDHQQQGNNNNRPQPPIHPLFVSINLTRQENEQPLICDGNSCGEEGAAAASSISSKPWTVTGISTGATKDAIDSCLWSSTSSSLSIPSVELPSSPLTQDYNAYENDDEDGEDNEDDDEQVDEDDEYYLHVNFEPDYNDIELHHVYDDQDEEYFYTYYIKRHDDEEDEEDEDEDEQDQEEETTTNDDDTTNSFQRKIYWFDDRDYEEYRHKLLYDIDDPYFNEKKYSSDESIQDEFGGTATDDDDDSESDSYCQRNSWKRKLFLTCNTFHEIPLDLHNSLSSDGGGDGISMDDNFSSSTSSYQTKYLGSGHFRNAFLFELPYSLDHDNNQNNEKFVYKVLRYIDEFHVDHADMERVQKEAIIMERLTHSPRTINTYGYCATSILTQAMQRSIWQQVVPGQGQMSQSELDTIQDQQSAGKSEDGGFSDVHPFNNYTIVQKLHMSLRMAEALADMHGYEHGVIVHGDVHPEQWLLDFNGDTILNDFNNAEILDYDPIEQEYCGSFRKQGGGVSWFICLSMLCVEYTFQVTQIMRFAHYVVPSTRRICWIIH